MNRMMMLAGAGLLLALNMAEAQTSAEPDLSSPSQAPRTETQKPTGPTGALQPVRPNGTVTPGRGDREAPSGTVVPAYPDGNNNGKPPG